jgi:RNA polymerase sigma-70 factor, ECF subfamily
MTFCFFNSTLFNDNLCILLPHTFFLTLCHPTCIWNLGLSEEDTMPLKNARTQRRTAPQTDEQRKEDLTLLRQVLEGQQSAWTRFCQRYESLIVGCVLRVLRRYNATFNSEDLADLVAEVWVTLLRDDMRKLRLYDPERGYKVASWLGLLASNCTIDQLRLRASETSYLEDMTCVETLLVDTSRPDAGIEQEEEACMARRALGQLTREERQFVVHCFHEERNPSELARDLGIAVNTVYSRKFKIREKLVRIVADLHASSGDVALAA